MRKLIASILGISTLFIGGLPAMASTDLSVSAPTAIEYDPTVSGFSVSGITITNAPDYIQVGLTVVDTAGTQVAANDLYRVAVGDQCSRDALWTNADTGNSVTVSGDNSTNVILAGAPEDITAILANTWLYQNLSDFCNRGSSSSFGQNLLNRKLQVSAVESQPGLYWSPSTHHYYQLATQTTDDGMGQPTNNSGQITDSTRYFVRWSTARSEAKSATISIGGQSHRGYLAAITTKDEFSFLNDNVTGGSGKLFPAWVGGSDGGQEGTWKWVDGPEAAEFGGDSLTHFVEQTTAPDGSVLLQNSDGDYYINFPTDGYEYDSWPDYVLLMRDGNGDFVYDSASGYHVVPNLDNYCSTYFADPYGALDSMATDGAEVDSTGYGSFITCNVYWDGYYPRVQMQLSDSNGQVYDPTPDSIYKLGDWGDYATDDNNNNLAVVVGTEDFTNFSGEMPNYEGATFWGPDWGGAPDSTPDYCHDRGIRGVCVQTQIDTTNNERTNSYYVNWSNGNASHITNWDGTGSKAGDGVYNPQPDNFNGNDSLGEAALVINWCARNSGVGSNTTAIEETLYGNPGYYCTPGWNDLAANSWIRSSSNYWGANYDTPNQIGTTDYVVEYCGYSDEASCAAPAGSVVSTSFSVASSSCPASGSPQLSVSYAGPDIDATDLSSATMVTETFDNVPAGTMTDQVTNVGYMTGTAAIGQAAIYGGAGGVGNFISAADELLTLPTTECYIGFWWSAGNADNNVDLLDSNGNVLASFNAGDLVAALGGCPNAYCGNPNQNHDNGGELYAYVHMRLPTGFQKVRFYGYGFELDNISVSVEVPSRSTNETNLSGPITMSLQTPDVIPVLPTAINVSLPELQVSGDANASLCLIQVADSEGRNLDNTSFAYSVPETDSVTLQPAGQFLVLSGAIADVITASGHLVIAKTDLTPVANAQSTYLRVLAVSGQNPDSTACSGGTSRIIEIRPIGIDLTQVFDIPITDHSN